MNKIQVYYGLIISVILLFGVKLFFDKDLKESAIKVLFIVGMMIFNYGIAIIYRRPLMPRHCGGAALGISTLNIKIMQEVSINKQAKEDVPFLTHPHFSEPLVGFEPTTPRLQITCSGQLS